MQYAEQKTTIPTLTPVKDGTPEVHSQYDAAGHGAFNLTRLEHLVADCDMQPDWRPRADLAAAYIDGKQFTPEQQAALIAEGMPDVKPTNLIGRVIRSICGSEAKARTDIKVEADQDRDSDVCDVLNASMKEAQRETYADMAVSGAYFGQVGPGVGWVEVAENCDPLEYPIRVSEVHRSEMWWDWKAKDTIIQRDGRWLCRKRWTDLDEIEARMPQHRQILRNVSNGWTGFVWDDSLGEERSVFAAYECENRWNNYRRRSDWYDSVRKRVKLYEVWYKTPAMGVILHLSPSRRLLYDPNSPLHVQAVTSGRIKVTKELTMQVRMSLFAGPHRLQDIGTTRRNFPYVPFFAYRDDEDLSPYGLVDGMMSPQDEYNARRIRVNWLLRARQITVDNDALDSDANTLSDVADSVMRPDLTVVLNSNRKNANGFQVSNSLVLQKEQVEVMQDAKQLIQDVPGVYGSQLGQAASGVTSGIANSLLIEQGAVAMGDLNDNYRHSRRMVFELLLEQIVRLHSERDLQVIIGRGKASRVVVLNHWNPQTSEIENNVSDAPLRVGLGEVPSTPAFRMQQQQQLATIIGALQANPQAVALLTPSFIESTDLPNRAELADDMRKSLGMPANGDKNAQQQLEQQQEQQRQQQAQAQQAAMQLEMESKAADINKTKSETELNHAKTFQIGHDAGLANAQASMPEPQQQADPEAQKQAAIDAAMQEAMGQGQQPAAPAAAAAPAAPPGGLAGAVAPQAVPA